MKMKKGDITSREAGRRGGKTTLQRKGPDFFREIGKLGGLKVSENREHMQKIGKKGGKSKKKK